MIIHTLTYKCDYPMCDAKIQHDEEVGSHMEVARPHPPRGWRMIQHELYCAKHTIMVGERITR